jgi:hypothetical protein
LMMTAQDKSRAYGDDNPPLTVSVSGFKNNDTLVPSVITGSPACSTPATATSPINGSPYKISCNTGSLTANNYTFAFVDGKLTVTPALLTVTADNKSRAYGAANPGFTFAIDGFKNSETASVLTTEPACTSIATASSPVGAYDITCSGAAAANYDFNYMKGALTVSQATLTVTANNQSRTYGAANLTFGFMITGFQNGEDATVLTTAPICTSVADASSNVGVYAITCAGGVAGNYAFSYGAGQLTITKTPLTVTPDDKSKTYGAAFTAFTGVIVGIKNNDNITADYASTGAAAGQAWASMTSRLRRMIPIANCLTTM